MKDKLLYLIVGCVIGLLIAGTIYVCTNDKDENTEEQVTTMTTTTTKVVRNKLFTEKIEDFSSDVTNVVLKKDNNEYNFEVIKNGKSVNYKFTNKVNNKKSYLMMNNEKIASTSTCYDEPRDIKVDYIIDEHNIYFVSSFVIENGAPECDYDSDQNIIYILDENGKILFKKEYATGQGQMILDDDYRDLFNGNFYGYNNSIYYMDKLNYSTSGYDDETWNINKITISNGNVTNKFYSTIKGSAAGAKS